MNQAEVKREVWFAVFAEVEAWTFEEAVQRMGLTDARDDQISKALGQVRAELAERSRQKTHNSPRRRT